MRRLGLGLGFGSLVKKFGAAIRARVIQWDDNDFLLWDDNSFAEWDD